MAEYILLATGDYLLLADGASRLERTTVPGPQRVSKANVYSVLMPPSGSITPW